MEPTQDKTLCPFYDGYCVMERCKIWDEEHYDCSVNVIKEYLRTMKK